MQTLETLKTRSQAGVTSLVEKAKEQPAEVKTWGVTAGGAVVGAITVSAIASGILAVLATLAAPPVALTGGAVGGGLVGWNYMRSRQTTPPPFTPPSASETRSVAESPAIAITTPTTLADAAGLPVLTPEIPEPSVSAETPTSVDDTPETPAEPASNADDGAGAQAATPLTTAPGDNLDVVTTPE